jgi:hypothetical protein
MLANVGKDGTIISIPAIRRANGQCTKNTSWNDTWQTTDENGKNWKTGFPGGATLT